MSLYWLPGFLDFTLLGFGCHFSGLQDKSVDSFWPPHSIGSDPSENEGRRPVPESTPVMTDPQFAALVDLVVLPYFWWRRIDALCQVHLQLWAPRADPFAPCCGVGLRRGKLNFGCPEAPDDFWALKQPGFENPKHLSGVSNGGVGSSIESPRSHWVDVRTFPFCQRMGFPLNH